MNARSQRFLVGILTAASCLPLSALAQGVGDRIIVVTKDAALTDGAEVVARIFRGSHLKVDRVNGEWYRATYLYNAGWVHRDDVILFDHGIDYFTETLRKKPNAEDYMNRARVWGAKGELNKAMQDFDEAVRIDPSPFTYGRRASEWERRGEFEKAITDRNEDIRLESIRHSSTLATAYLMRGDVWLVKSDYDQAIADYSEAIRIRPTWGSFYSARAEAWAKKGEFDRAIADAGEAIRLEPAEAFGYIGRGEVWSAKGEYGNAVADLNEAVRVEPMSWRAYDARAWFRATCPDETYRDGAQAIEDAKKACELALWSNYRPVSTLAAAYAEARDFDNAIKSQVQAVAFFTTDPEKKFYNLFRSFENECRSRLELYKAGRPYRDEPKN